LVWPNSTSNAFPVGGITGAVGQRHLPGEGAGGGQSQLEIADELHPIIENVLDELDRWLSA
jgi:hypothetical protein